MENDFEDGLIVFLLCPADSVRGVRSGGGGGAAGREATATWRNVAITIVMQSYTFGGFVRVYVCRCLSNL